MSRRLDEQMFFYFERGKKTKESWPYGLRRSSRVVSMSKVLEALGFP